MPSAFRSESGLNARYAGLSGRCPKVPLAAPNESTANRIINTHLASRPVRAGSAANTLRRNFHRSQTSTAAAGTHTATAAICPETIIEMTSFG